MPGSRKLLVATNVSHAGLGNRARFTLSALSLAEAEGRDFAYAWPQTDHFRPAFTSLWEFNATEISWHESTELAKEVPYVEQWRDLPTDGRALSIWNFRSGDALPLPDGAVPWAQRFRELNPVDEIRQRVRTIHEEQLRDQTYVGVMIRAHQKSHAKSLQASPVEWYMGRMAEIKQINPNVKFFISCDVPEVQKRIVEAFPGSVGQVNKGGYNSADGVISSVVDLYLLGASKYMLIPYWSSFPTLAWELAGRKIGMEHSMGAKKDFQISLVPDALDPLHPANRNP